VPDRDGRRDVSPVLRSAGPPASGDVVGLRVGVRVRVRVWLGEGRSVVELVDGDSVGDVDVDDDDEVDEDEEDDGLDVSSSVADRLLLGDGSSRVEPRVEVPVDRAVTSGALLLPPKAGGGKSSTSVPSSAAFMKDVQTRTGTLPPVTSLRPPRPFRDSCTALPSLTPPRYSPTAAAS